MGALLTYNACAPVSGGVDLEKRLAAGGDGHHFLPVIGADLIYQEVAAVGGIEPDGEVALAVVGELPGAGTACPNIRDVVACARKGDSGAVLCKDDVCVVLFCVGEMFDGIRPGAVGRDFKGIGRCTFQKDVSVIGPDRVDQQICIAGIIV